MAVWSAILTHEHIPVRPAECQAGRVTSVRLQEVSVTAETTSREENLQDRGDGAWTTAVAPAAWASLGRNTRGCYL